MNRSNRPAHGRLLLLTTLLLAPACVGPVTDSPPEVLPQRPFLSTTSRTTPKDRIELEVGGEVDPGSRIDTPTYLKYGLSERTELFLGTSPYSMVDHDEQLPDGSGWGDTYVGFRHRLADRSTRSPAYGFDIQTKLPTARPRKGLGSGEMDWLISANASQSYYGHDLTAYYQLGLLGEQGDDGLDLRHTTALQTRTPLDQRFTGLGEVAIVWEPELNREELTLFFGASYTLNSWTLVDFGLRLGLTPDAPDIQLVFGLTRALGILAFPSSRDENR
jgi:hypothetical protein